MPQLLIIRALATVVMLSSAFAATWQTKHGRSFEAEPKMIQGDEVVFEAPNGRTFSMKAHELSSDSRQRLTKKSAGSNDSVNAVSRGILRTGNYKREWPREARYSSGSSVRLVKKDKSNHRFEYASPNYRFISDVELTDQVVRDFAVLFETTYEFCQRLPLSMEKSGSGANKSVVYLFGSKADYVRAGGPAASAGCCFSSKDVVLVPLASLGITRRGSNYVLDRNKQNMVLVHELVHQLTPKSYYAQGARGWFSEGLAEYIAASPYMWGYFQADRYGQATKAYVSGHGLKGKGGRALGSVIQAPSLKHLMTMSYGEFSGDNASVNYAVGLLCTHHFFHTDGQRRARRITRFLQALDGGQSGAQALNHLLDGRSFEQVEKEIAAGWKAKGLTIHFGN